MTLGEYERVRSQRDRFAVVPGHDGDRGVWSKRLRYFVVDKRDEVEHLVE